MHPLVISRHRPLASTMLQTIESFVLLALASCLFGCGGATGRASVSGTVTLDGEPVENGAITLVAVTGDEGPTGANIVDGSYRIRKTQGPVAGHFRVEIRWSKPTGKKILVMDGIPDSGMRDELAEAIPAKYNKESVLEIEIQKGNNQRDFELTTSE